MKDEQNGNSTPIRQDSSDTPYDGERSTKPDGQLPYINQRNNNMEVSTPDSRGQTIETANNEHIGDSAVNDEKLTDYTSNHSADA